MRELVEAGAVPGLLAYQREQAIGCVALVALRAELTSMGVP